MSEGGDALWAGLGGAGGGGGGINGTQKGHSKGILLDFAKNKNTVLDSCCSSLFSSPPCNIPRNMSCTCSVPKQHCCEQPSVYSERCTRRLPWVCNIYSEQRVITYVLVISPLGVMLLVYRPDTRGPINRNITTKR